MFLKFFTSLNSVKNLIFAKVLYNVDLNHFQPYHNAKKNYLSMAYYGRHLCSKSKFGSSENR